MFKELSDDIGLALHSIISEAKRLEIEKDLNVANLKLKATNQQLQSSEQQLQASNQQLQAGEQQLQASNQQLRATNQQLQAGEQQLIKNEEELISVNHSLKERIKEITCIFNITSTIIEHDTIDEILSNIVQFLPPAWNYPETTVARIQFQNKIFHSNNFKETQWKQSADIMVDSASQGSIDIFYLTEKPILYEGPFLKEERALIDTLSRIIGKSIENILKKEQVQAINQQLQAGEQQLQASNQQLRATNQQLQAGEQQLQASNQQLRAINQQLQSSELKYRNQANFLDVVTESSPFAMWVSDAKGIMIRANQALRNILNLTDEMIIGKYNVLHDENMDVQGFMPVVEAVFNNLKSARFTMYWTGTKAGDVDLSVANELWIDVSMFPITDEAGKLVNVVCQYVDITELKLAEEALQETNAKHSAMIENIGDVIAIVESDGMTKYQSPNIEKWFGWKPEDIIGTNGWDKMHPEDVERIQENFSKVLEKETASFVEYRFKCKDGNYKWIELTALNRINEPAINGVLVNYHDITERKQAEKALSESEQFSRSIIDNSTDCIKILDLDGNLKFMSKGGQTLLEIDNIDQFLNKSWIDLWKGEDNKNARNAIEKAKSEEVGYFEGYCPTNKGTPKWWGVQISPIYDSDGKIKELLAVSRDITNRKKAENIKDLILNISNATYQTLNLEDLVLKIEQEISTVVNTKNIYFVLHDQEKNKLNMLLHKDEEDVFQGFPETGTLTHYLLKTGKPLLAKKNTFKELREAGETLKFGTDPKIWLGVPFSIKGRVLGAIVVQSYEDANAFNMDDLMVLKVVSDQIGISIERKIFEEKMIVAKFKAEESDRL